MGLGYRGLRAVDSCSIPFQAVLLFGRLLPRHDVSTSKFSVSPRGSVPVPMASALSPSQLPSDLLPYFIVFSCLSPSDLFSLLFLSYPWRNSAPCILFCQVSAPRHSRPSLSESWLALVPAWVLNCQGFQLARLQHCCRPFGYEKREEEINRRWVIYRG